MESEYQKRMSQTTPKINYQLIGDPTRLPKLNFMQFSGDHQEWTEWAEIFDVIVHPKRQSDSDMMQYLKISLTGHAKAAIAGLGFSSLS